MSSSEILGATLGKYLAVTTWKIIVQIVER